MFLQDKQLYDLNRFSTDIGASSRNFGGMMEIVRTEMYSC
jgi:hypothetical protein